MSVKKPYWQVSRENSMPLLRVLLVSDSVFLGFHVALELLKKGVEVYYSKNRAEPNRELKALKQFSHFHICGKELPSGLDYIFQINAVCQKKDIFSPLKLLGLAHSQGAKFLFATVYWQDFSRRLFCDWTREKKVNWRLVHFNFVYGDSGAQTSVLENIFRQIKQGKILIAGDGEEKIYPLFIGDFVQGLLRAMFSRDSKGRLYRLTGLEQTKLLDFAWRIKRVSGKALEVVFVASHSSKSWSIDSFLLEKIKKSWWRLVYKPNIDFDEGIRWSLAELLKRKEGVGGEFLRRIFKLKLPKFSPAFCRIKLASLPLFTLAFLLSFLIIFSPFFIFLGFSIRGVSRFQKLENKIGESEALSLSEDILSAKKDFLMSRKILWQFSPVISFVGLGKKAEGVENLLNLAIELTNSLESINQAHVRAKSLGEIVFQNKVADPKKELEGLLVELSLVDQKLGFAQTQAEKVESFGLPFEKDFEGKLKKLKEQLPFSREKINFSRRLLLLASNFLAFDGKKSYLLLLQNNMELRPTGGFIGSYAILTFEKGRLLDFLVEDVYSADGQLKGHVEPPEPIKKYLGEANWYLRDSNFSPDFPTAAAQAEWFLEKETGQQVDGVIAVNLNFVKSLLQVIGEVHLPEYNEKISAQNLFERAEYHTEVDFFPGSTQKKSFLTSLSNFLFESLKNLPALSCLDLFQKIHENLEEKDIMIFTHEKVLQQKIRFFGWDGRVRKAAFNKTSQFAGPGMIDYLMIVDTNVGVNKVNYFISRELEFEATILKEGGVVNRLNLIYKNASSSQSWPGGTYKNYLRILLPSDVEKVNIKESEGAKEGKEDFKILDSTKIERTAEFDKSVFGFLLQVPPGESKKVLITFERAEKLYFGNRLFDYLFYLQKQSGIKNDPLTVKVNFPAFLKPVKIMPKGSLGPQSVTFQTELDKDSFFAIEFSH